jgi:antitoxin component YwqK of YwqJK toxin-antitoxin module
MAKWFVVRAGKEVGPLTGQQLKEMAAAGKLREADMVRREDMAQPTKASNVKGLLPVQSTGASPPPLPNGARAGTAEREKVDKSVPVGKLRKRLTAFADKIPHHEIKNLGETITVVVARRLPVYSIEWTVLFERREAAERQRPNDGTGAVPRRGFDPHTYDVWAQQLPHPTGFESKTEEVPLEGTQRVRKCGQCAAEGAVTCDGCGGQQQVSCPNCNGSGVQACGGCLGTGRTLESYTERRQQHCRGPILAGVPSHCNGGFDKHGRVCSNCNGTGIEWYNHTGMRQAPCPACGAGGRVRCGSCNAAGVVTCPRCQGNGRLTCPTCSGDGQVVHYLAAIRSFEPHSASLVVPAKECPKRCVEALDARADFEQVLQTANLEGELAPDLGDGMEHLSGDVRDVQMKVRAGVKAEGRLAGERLRIGRASVYRLDYSLDGKAFTAWFAGDDGPVHAPVNPLTDSVARSVEAATAAWSEGRQREGEWVLRKALAMAKSSPECARTLEPLKPRIPEELLRRASSFSLRFWFQHLGPVGKALVGVPAGCLGLFIAAFCFACIVGIFVTPSSKRQSADQKVGSGKEPVPAKAQREQEKLIAEIEAQAPPVPEFPEAEYQHDFTKDDYETIPAGAKKETRTEINKSGDSDIDGKPETVEGYVEPSGKFVQHGAFTTWTDDTKTKKIREGKALNGRRHGVTRYFYPDGKRQSEMQWVNGERHGVGRGWHESGQLQFENHRINGQFHGRRRNWYDNGEPEFDETWVRGRLHGVSKYWFKDGRLAAIGCYREGKKNGKVWSQNEDGTPGETGEWEDGKPKGRCRFPFVGPDKKRYYVEVSDEDWKGGTTAEFIARMYYFAMRDRPDLGLQFDPKSKIANYFSSSAEEFFARFGRPTQDALDFEKAPGGAPGHIRDRYRIWSYRCTDGTLRLRVQPTQSGDLMVTAHWRDNPS